MRPSIPTLRDPSRIATARRLRASMTDAERRLWYYLRGRRFRDWRFRRQEPLGPYVVDFVCARARLVVEVDGGQHAERLAEDRARSAWLAENGFRVARYWNNDVMRDTGGVLEDLARELESCLPSPRPSP